MRDAVPTCARGDYAANGGDTDFRYSFPAAWIAAVAYQDGDSPTYNWPKPQPPNYVEIFTGIHYLRSEIKIADITDGTSNTYHGRRKVRQLRLVLHRPRPRRRSEPLLGLQQRQFAVHQSRI